jgi:hypothetical protein
MQHPNNSWIHVLVVLQRKGAVLKQKYVNFCSSTSSDRTVKPLSTVSEGNVKNKKCGKTTVVEKHLMCYKHKKTKKLKIILFLLRSAKLINK